MKPKAPTEHEDGLLEYLEDIIGTAKYKEPIDEAMIEVERLQEDRQIKLNRLRLVEKEKAALEERKKEAEDFLRLKNELVRARSREIQWYLWKFFEMENKFKTQIVCIWSCSRRVVSSLLQTTGQTEEGVGKRDGTAQG